MGLVWPAVKAKHHIGDKTTSIGSSQGGLQVGTPLFIENFDTIADTIIVCRFLEAGVRTRTQRTEIELAPPRPRRDEETTEGVFLSRGGAAAGGVCESRFGRLEGASERAREREIDCNRATRGSYSSSR